MSWKSAPKSTPLKWVFAYSFNNEKKDITRFGESWWFHRERIIILLAFTSCTAILLICHPPVFVLNIFFLSPQCLPWFFSHSSLHSCIESSPYSKNWSYNNFHVPFSSSHHFFILGMNFAPMNSLLSRFSHALSQAQ